MWRFSPALLAGSIIVLFAADAFAQNCAPGITLRCSDTDHWSNDGYGSTSELTEYSCPGSLSGYDGDEYAYTFVASGTGDVTVTLSGLAADLDLFVLTDLGSGCDPIDCVDFSDSASTGDETVTFSATAGETYYFVVDGFSGATSDFDIQVECGYDVPCSPAFPLSCGGSDSWSTSRFGSTDVVDSYSCSSWSETGREYVYSFVASATGTATVALSDLESGTDLDIFVLDGSGGICDSTTCLSFGSRTATFDITEGQTYYLSVDGYLGDEGSFTISLSCELEDRCSPAEALTCGETVSWNNGNAGSTDMIVEYGCSDSCGSWVESGPEYAYSFVAPVDGDYSATLSGIESGEDLDIYVLDGGSGDVCSPDDCIACGTVSASWTATAGTTYYVVVDGYRESVSDYELTISCPALDVCVPAGPISCGGYILSSTLDDDATDNIDSYSCSTWTENGPEMAYTFTARASSEVTASIHSLTVGQDLDVFVVSDSDGICDPDGCLAYGGTTTTFDAVEGETYYVVVDGYFGDAGDFSLELDCAIGCRPRLALACGDFEEGNNGADGSTNNISTYACVGWEESGPEYAYSFVPTEDGQITVTIAADAENLDVFVMSDADGDCNPEACIAYGEDEATFDAVTGETYYIVVDGFEGAIDDYLIEVSCAAPACDLDRDGHDADTAECGGDDCDDDAPGVHPGAEEICGDGVDQDCDGEDELCPDCTDSDGDGWGVGATCVGDPDCDDTAVDIYPGAVERCGDGIDQDCDGADLECPCGDRDGDGYDAGDGCDPPIDCDDSDGDIHPFAPEICGDGIDQDCDGSDETCPTCVDRDGDRYGDGDGCLGSDCDDFNRLINPEAEEICGNGVDEDCDGSDEPCATDCVDEDGDGYGDGSDCEGPDCDDTDADINPGARDDCGDGVDQDCDGADAECPCDDDDGDGFSAEDCGGDDCNDGDETIYPGADEVCGDGIDQDCNGADEECECPDADGDGFTDRACGGEDCDDSNPDFNPDAEDPCGDGIDQNCDGADDCECVDEDGDGWGTSERCAQSGDCDDTDDTVHPGATDICGDGIDQDCDGADDCCMCSDDIDGDGIVSAACCGGEDCDDTDPDVSPIAPEICGNEIDDNCNGEIDEEGCAGEATSASGCDCDVVASRPDRGLGELLLLMLGFFGTVALGRRR